MSSPKAPHLEDGADLGTAFKALNHPIRRRVLVGLREGESRDVEAFVSGQDEAQSIEIQLQHTHLPRLDDYGYIDWDRTGGTVRPGPAYDTIDPLLQVLDDHQHKLPGQWP